MTKTIIGLAILGTISLNAEQYLYGIESKVYANSIVVTESNTSVNQGDSGNSDNSGTIYSSCDETLSNNPSAPSGSYQINVNSGTITVYCDMTTDGGGWTLVSHIYDRDNRDDIVNNSGGSAWGDSAVTSPTQDSSFNISTSDTPTYTESKYEWIYPDQGDTFSHSGNSVLIDNRFNWGSSGSTTLLANLQPLGVNNVASDGRISGVFGRYTFSENGIYLLNVGHRCGNGLTHGNALHYWGYGAIIDFNGSITHELHNLPNGTNRASNAYCGTRNTILNIWVR